jgi:hypothetical protein
VWLKQINRLLLLPGADTTTLLIVRDWICNGIKSTFRGGPPPPGAFKNTFTFEKNQDACMERLRYYRDLGALAHLSDPPPPGGYKYVQPLHAVLKPGKKPRICVDFKRNFNDYLTDFPFHYQSVQAAAELAAECTDHELPAFFCKLDISACFLSFPIHPDDRDFYVVQAGGDFYEFVCLAFGHKSAPFIVSTLLDVVSSALLDAGIEHSRYLDDFFIVATSAARAAASAHAAAAIIRDFGLAIALDKFEGPAQSLEFLGIVVDSLDRCLRISTARQAELTELLTDFLHRPWASRRRLESLLGKLSFAATVLPGARPFLRRIIDTLCSRPTGRIRLQGSFRSDVRYWLGHMASWNGRALWRRSTSTPFVFGSDASTTGFAYGLESSPTDAHLPASMQCGAIRVGIWSQSAGHLLRQSSSSTIQWGEFFCPLAAAAEYGALLANSHVVFVIDNESDVHIINRGRTRDPAVAILLRALCDTANRHNFSFSAVHRSGAANTLMDWASRPDLHKFTTRLPAFSASEAAPCGCRGGCGGGSGGVCNFPPLLRASHMSLLFSTCLRFSTTNDSVSWTRTFGR